MKAVLLINTGSPESPEPAAVRRYLAEFLMDPMILDLPWPVRAALVYGWILPRRVPRVAEAYRRIWAQEGFPLQVISRRFVAKVQEKVSVPVVLGMRYGRPSLAEALQKLTVQGVRHCLVLPLFPQYAQPTWGSIRTFLRRILPRVAPDLKVTFLAPFYRDPDYLKALLAVARPYLEQSWDHWLFSFHGVPLRHLRKSDPTGRYCLRAPNCCEAPPEEVRRFCYRHQCLQLARHFTQLASIPRWSIAFQSRLGPGRWLQPETFAELRRLAQAGVRRLIVCCPSFVTDCLETIKEIGQEGRRVFLEAGGETFALVPSLNDHPQWIGTVVGWIERFVRQEPLKVLK